LTPFKLNPRNTTASVDPALIAMAMLLGVIPAVPAPSLATVSAVVMVKGPKSPPSNTSISPPAEVLEYAPANVEHGDARVHGLASLPVPETQVRGADVAWAAPACSRTLEIIAMALNEVTIFVMARLDF
jgi:hypothetical protein